MAAMFSHAQEQQITDFLIDYVDGTAPLTTLLKHYNLSLDDIGDLVDLTDRLRAVLVEVTPSQTFVEQLLLEFAEHGHISRNWWNRVPSVPVRMPSLPDIQGMSNRSKLAAGIGGLTLVYLTARSLSFLLNMRQQEDSTGEMVA